ncbi:MAG TPA: hypothetical protein VHO24_11665 [Opitutaceae bacterium]|nr:hypothetical protein [Opitutaceae bacterium]
MTYIIETASGTWKIEEDSQRNWVVLKLKRGTAAWRVINIFYTVGGAAAAVGCGETSDPAWDNLPHNSAEFILARWQPEKIADDSASAA